MTDKTEATRLADALRRFHASTPVWAADDRNQLEQAEQMLRRWPDGRADFVFQSALEIPDYPHFPSWASVAVMSRPYWAKITDRIDTSDERIAALEAALEQARVALEHIDLDARVARPYVGQVSRLGGLARDALRAIEEVRRG